MYVEQVCPVGLGCGRTASAKGVKDPPQKGGYVTICDKKKPKCLFKGWTDGSIAQKGNIRNGRGP